VPKKVLLGIKIGFRGDLMYKNFGNYYWKNGKPYGFDEVDPSKAPFSYKIVIDPYFRRFSIEKYLYTQFEKVVYDSHLLDFRHLSLKDQVAWQREVLKEGGSQSICLLRNQDDRAVLLETLTFDQNQCRTCETSSVHGVPLAVHRMYYQSMKDSFDGVVLYDMEERPVMMKIYETDPQTGEFTNLIREEWDMQKGLECGDLSLQLDTSFS
jgi:hypothetical protein